MDMTPRTAGRLLKVIADESRLRILGLLAKTRSSARGSHQAQPDPADRQHNMRKMVDAGIVTPERRTV